MSLINQTRPPILIGTVGLPQSGKSTWARKQGLPMASTDGVRFAIHGTPWRPEVETLVWGHTEVMVRSLFNAGHDRVLLDATNVSPEARRKWFCNDWLTMWVMFKTSPTICTTRAERNDPNEVKVIESMTKWLVWPEENALLPKQLDKPLAEYSYLALLRVLASVKRSQTTRSPKHGETSASGKT